MSSTARRRTAQLRRMRSRRSGGRGESAAGTFRLVLCALAFILLVGVKLLFPETVDRLADSARRLIGQDADFREAFAAVGRAVSGEQPVADSLQDAYAAVFNPVPQPEQTPEPAVPDPGPAALPQEPDAAADAVPGAQLLRYTALTLPAAEKPAVRELVVIPGGEGLASQPDADAPEEEDSAATTEASYIYTMPALPENASLEQRNLGFDHCTPVQGKLSSTFGWREHPVEGGNRFHYGVDLAADTGADVLAFADGEVYATGESSTLGNYIMLRHEGGYVTLYAHCSRVLATGGSVAMGDKIAEVGSTGLATGPHLHFELHDGDLYLNPIFYVSVG